MITVKVLALLLVVVLGTDATGLTDILPRIDVIVDWLSK